MENENKEKTVMFARVWVFWLGGVAAEHAKKHSIVKRTEGTVSEIAAVYTRMNASSQNKNTKMVLSK